MGKRSISICRSLTGEGNRLTIKYFKKLNPEFKNLKFKTGKKFSIGLFHMNGM